MLTFHGFMSGAEAGNPHSKVGWQIRFGTPGEATCWSPRRGPGLIARPLSILGAVLFLQLEESCSQSVKESTCLWFHYTWVLVF